MELVTGKNSNVAIQVFKLAPNRKNISTGTFMTDTIYCVADGSFTMSEDNATINMSSGEVFGFNRQDITITSGTFHLGE